MALNVMEKYKVPCGGYMIDGYYKYCHIDGKPYSCQDTCNLDINDRARMQCALFCDDVKGRLARPDGLEQQLKLVSQNEQIYQIMTFVLGGLLVACLISLCISAYKLYHRNKMSDRKKDDEETCPLQYSGSSGTDTTTTSEISSHSANSIEDKFANIPPENDHIDPTKERNSNVKYAIGGRKTNVTSLPPRD